MICRVPSHNPFTAGRNGEYHTLRSSVRRITSGESAGSPLGPNRSSQSVPALIRLPRSAAVSADGHDEHLSGEDRRRTSESFLWENEPMSAAAALGSHQIDQLGRSFSTRRTSANVSFNAAGDLNAASCVWENEPRSAAASLSFSVAVPRLSLERVSEGPEMLPETSDGAPAPSSLEPVVVPKLASVQTHIPVTSSRSGVTAWRPHRPAPPPPPQRANSFPNPRQNEDYLEYEVTSSLTLKETPRSQRRHELQREMWEAQAKAAATTELASAVAHHHRTADSPHVSFAAFPSLPPDPSPLVTSMRVEPVAAAYPQDLAAAAAAAYAAETAVNSLINSGSLMSTMPLLPAPTVQEAHQLSLPATMHSGPDVRGDNQISIEETSLMTRHASVMSLYESAHSGALSEGTDSDE